jgi:large subunit ribosomal protein L2
MAIVIYKPTSAGRRISSVNKQADLTAPTVKRLLKKRKVHSGRNNQGKITIRHRSGGVKKHLRMIDFKRDKFGVPAQVAAMEYDPNRSARLALVKYRDGQTSYIIAGEGLKVGQTIFSSSDQLDILVGNNMPLKFIPAGQAVHNVELSPNAGAKLGRSAGNVIIVMGKEAGMVQLKMPSGEVRLVSEGCRATVGAVGNSAHGSIRWGKAGRMRHRGRRPTVRGKAMNPVDHPHGGGEGNQPIGLKHPKTPWGKPALGVKSRKPHLPSSKLILKRRPTKKDK